MRPGQASLSVNCPHIALPEFVRQLLGLFTGEAQPPMRALPPVFAVAPYAIRNSRPAGRDKRYAPRWG